MRTIYRTHFELSPKAETQPTFQTVTQMVRDWAVARPGVQVPSWIDLLTTQTQMEVSTGRYLETKAYEGPKGKAWGLRLMMPDDEPEIEWATETVVYEESPDHLWFSCTLLVGRRGETLSPVFRPPNRPGIVSTVLSTYQGCGLLPLTDGALGCSEGDVEILLRLLESPSRRHPLVFVSTDPDGGLMTDTKKLADNLAGLAFVVVAKSPEVSEKLGQHLPRQLNCFNAGVRLYWPGFSRKSPPLHHPLWTRPRIKDLNQQHPARLGSQILSRIASVSHSSRPLLLSLGPSSLNGSGPKRSKKPRRIIAKANCSHSLKMTTRN